MKNIKLFTIYKTCQYIKLVKQSWKVQGRLLGKGLFCSLFFSPARWIQTIYWRTSLRRVEAKYFYRRIRSCGSVTCPSEMICREFVFFRRIFESRNCDLRLRNAKPGPSSWPCIAFVDGFGLASKTIIITVFLKPIYALSIPLSSTFAQFKELFDQLSYVLTDITVPRLKDAKEKQKFSANPFWTGK